MKQRAAMDGACPEERNSMLQRALRLLRMPPRGSCLHWLNGSLAIGRAESAGDRRSAHSAGIRAVVDVTLAPGEDDGAAVRQLGMRYLNLPLNGRLIPTADELHLVTGWISERLEEGRVLIQDSHGRFNDGLIAAAALIRGGLPAHLALLALRRAQPAQGLDYDQSGVLIQFSGALPLDLPDVKPGPSRSPLAP